MMMEEATMPCERRSKRSPDHLGLHLLDAVGRPKNHVQFPEELQRHRPTTFFRAE